MAQEAGEPKSVLEANIRELMRRRSIGGIGALRSAMKKAGYTVGTSTIQRALQGGESNRINTLEKFAKFFDVTKDQLLQPRLGLADGEELPPRPEVEQLTPQIRQLLADLNDIPDAKRSRLIDQIHQAAEEAREAAEHFRNREKATAAAAHRGSGRATASVSYGDGNARQKSFPWTTVQDPFTASPDEREGAWYRRIERAPKGE